VVKRFVVIAALAWVGGACASFESEDIVIDMRVLAMSATVPEQMVDVDLDNPPEPLDLLDQLVPTTMCALVADPVEARRIDYRLTLCVLTNDERCDADDPQVPLVAAIAEDPELSVPAPQLCATIEPDGNLAGIALAALEGDVLRGLGGVDYGVELQVQPEGNTDPDQLLFAGKTLRISPRIPAERTANTNPTIDHFDAGKDGINPEPLPMGRCVDQTAPLTLVPTQRVRITPVEPPDAREVYTVPTIDGQSETFTESLTYQWLAGAGSFSAGSTGGPRDTVTGNPAPLFSDFRAPAEIDGVTDIPLWIIQRDERLGSVWYETCIRVVPE
jgi:hypothetical protein